VLVAPGETGASDETQCGQPGRRSHGLLAILFGIADHGRSRREVLRTIQEASGRRRIIEVVMVLRCISYSFIRDSLTEVDLRLACRGPGMRLGR
jgi:hypothetical protein